MAQANSPSRSNKFALIAFTALITASATFLLSTQFNQSPPPRVEENKPETTSRLRYFNDNITISGTNPSGENLLILLDLYRKEIVPGKFLHYYYAHYWNGEQEIHDYTSFQSSDSTVQTNDFLKTYNISGDKDLSTREYLNFTVNLDGQTISANSKGQLEGDFITKNSLNYTRYLSLDRIDINIANQGIVQADLALEKAYADDHSLFVYFPGYQTLKSRTYRFLVWDNIGNFYLIDDSKVDKPNKHYADHTWILHQNPNKQNEKFFYATIKFNQKNEEKFWQISIDGNQLKLHTTYPTEKNWVDGPIFGTLEQYDKTTDLHGTFSYKKE